MSSVLRTALVTGAARGIGRSIALQLAKDGYQVAISDLPKQETLALKVVEEINKLGRKSVFVPADSSVRDEIFNAVEVAHRKLGSFNTIVNNAGIAQVSPVTHITQKEFHNVLNINIGGTLWGIQAAAQKFQELKQPGKIINAGSIASHQGLESLGLYSASKFGVKALTQAASKELAAKKITVNAYCPGIVLTPMWDLIDQKMSEFTGAERGATLKKFVLSISLGRGEEPQDVANLVSFLASEKADYITGQSYIVDGGLFYN